MLRGLRTLDKFPPFWNLDPEGKGAGGLRGLAPWRSMRRRLMRAFRARRPPVSLPVLSPANSPGIAFCPLTPAPLSPCFHTHSFCSSRCGAIWCSQFKGCCHLSVELREPGYLASHVLPRTRSHPNPALTHTLQKFILSFRSLKLQTLPGSQLLCRGLACCLPLVMRIVHFPGHPQPMQQHRQFARDGYRRGFLTPLTVALLAITLLQP